MAEYIKALTICLFVLFGFVGAWKVSEAEKYFSFKLFPEEQVIMERCIATCNAKKCPDDFSKIHKDPVTKEASCEFSCRIFPDCNDQPMSQFIRLNDRTKVYNNTMKDDNFKEECAQHCEKVTGQEPLPGAKGAASVKMAKTECKLRCKIASYMYSD